MRQGLIRQVHENSLAIAQRCDTDQGPDGLDVAARLAYEAADIRVCELDLDGHGATASLEGLHLDLVRLLRQRTRYEFNQGPVVHSGACRSWRTLAPEASVVAAAPPWVTPYRSTSLGVAQESPPASIGSWRLRSAERPGGASARLCRRRSSPVSGLSSDRSTRGAR